MASASSGQVRIKLSTRQADIALPEAPGPILVSTGFKRITLSELVNNLLQTERRIPFDFLINGQILRTSIDAFLTANGIAAETTLEVEYVRALVPPVHVSSFEQDDWVSSVDVLSATSPAGKAAGAVERERILSGGYDGLFRVWDTSSRLLATSPAADGGGHTLAVKAVRFVTPTRVVSSSLDRTIRIWDWDDGAHGAFKPVLNLYGHRSSVDSLAVHAPSSRILTASADHKVGYWSASKADAPAAPSNLVPKASGKKRKLNGSTADTPKNAPPPQRGPLSLLQGHKGPVSEAAFAPHDHTVAYSASWDHTLKTWDLPTGACVDTRSTSAALFSLAPLPGVGLVAAGSSARHIALVDARASAASVAAMTLRGHRNAVVSLAPDPGGAHGLVSASHDGTCRIWDVRSVRPGAGHQLGEPVYTMLRQSMTEAGRTRLPVAGDGVKVFGVVWDGDVGIVSGGEDRRIQINSKGEGGAGREM